MKKGIEIVIGIVIGVVMTVILMIGLVVGGWFYIDRTSRETTQNEEQKKTEEQQLKIMIVNELTLAILDYLNY